MTEEDQAVPHDDVSQTDLKMVPMDDFAAVEYEVPIANSHKVDCMGLNSLYQEAAKAQSEAGNENAARVFQLLGSVCQIHFKPNDRAEPYGPMAVFDGKRSIIPSDLRGEQSAVFAKIAPNIRNPGLRARLRQPKGNAECR